MEKPSSAETLLGFLVQVNEELPELPDHTDVWEGQFSVDVVLDLGQAKLPPILQGGHMAYLQKKSVFVRQYTRFRLGKWEQVCQHWRSHPHQLALFR